MSEPTVCAIMLTRDRPELAKKAVECFRKQTYLNKTLLVWDTSTEMKPAKRLDVRQFAPDIQHAFYGPQDYAIGALRNHAIQYGTSEVVCTVGVNKELTGPADIIVHFDDDDWSHTNRIAEQVELLQSSGAEVVGMNEMLFWRDTVPAMVRSNFEAMTKTFPPDAFPLPEHLRMREGEAWLYSGPTAMQSLGTSLCYWRKTWEARPFNPQLPRTDGTGGEDWDFLRDRKVVAVSSLAFPDKCPQCKYGEVLRLADGSWTCRTGGCELVGLPEPRMIARIHSGNSSASYAGIDKADRWKRVPEWDDRVREILK